MKLWLKISIISGVVLLFVVAICSLFLLFFVKDSIIQMTTNQAISEQQNLSASFVATINYYLTDDSNDVVKESALKYAFSRLADSTAVLLWEDKTIYSSINFSPTDYLVLAEPYEQQVFEGQIQGRDVLMVGSKVVQATDNYYVYVVKDITPVYDSIRMIVWRFVGIGLACISGGVLLLVVLLRKASKPLTQLQQAASRIAVGKYEERVPMHAKDEVGLLAADFNEMVEAIQLHIGRLEDIAKRQQLFMGGLTHEFKTPLTSLIIHSDTLLTTKLSLEETQNSLLHMNEQCHWLERLTSKMLQLITLGNRIDKKLVPVAQLLGDVALTMSQLLKDRNTPLLIECSSASLLVDYDLTKSLLINVIDNASKASDSGQSITLKAYENMIEVKDQGKGIPEDDLERITDPFYRVDPSRSKNSGGSGIGLALVKEIAAAHQAELIIQSTLGVGTTVQVIFP